MIDIENIAEFIAKDSERYASIQVERFFDETIIFEQFPYAGRIVPEIKNRYIREIILGNYRITSKDIIDILTVHHSSILIMNIRLRQLPPYIHYQVDKP